MHKILMIALLLSGLSQAMEKEVVAPSLLMELPTELHLQIMLRMVRGEKSLESLRALNGTSTHFRKVIRDNSWQLLEQMLNKPPKPPKPASTKKPHIYFSKH